MGAGDPCAPTACNAHRRRNREVQTALNYVGIDAGSPDGVLGQRTTAAVSFMEAVLAMPAEGRLTSFERDVLLGAPARATSGNRETARLTSTSPRGARRARGAARHDDRRRHGHGRAGADHPDLPLEVSGAVDETAASSDPPAEQLPERAGFVQLTWLHGDGSNDDILDTSYAGSSFWRSANAYKTLVFVSTPRGYARNDLLAHAPTTATFSCQGASCRLAEPGATVMASAAPQPEVPLAVPQIVVSAPLLPTFGAAPVVAVSLARHCGKVSLLTATRGGLVEASAGGDADMALAERFCLVRNLALDPSEQMIAAMPGTTMPDVEARCGGLGDAMSAPFATLPAEPAAEVVAEVAALAGTTGMAPDRLRTTAALCLSAGYADDDIDAAIGSAMLLVAMGSPPYAELVAQHLHSGIGTTKRPDHTRGRFDAAFDALRGGAQPVCPARLGGGRPGGRCGAAGAAGLCHAADLRRIDGPVEVMRPSGPPMHGGRIPPFLRRFASLSPRHAEAKMRSWRNW